VLGIPNERFWADTQERSIVAEMQALDREHATQSGAAEGGERLPRANFPVDRTMALSGPAG
jgi:hypothetical protein